MAIKKSELYSSSGPVAMSYAAVWMLASTPGYVYHQIFSAGIASQIDALLTGTNYPAINSGDVRALQIPLPDMAEQTAIATILSDVDADIAALETKLNKARHIKQGMMQQLLTGKIRLV